MIANTISSIPSIGSLLGTSSPQDLINEINASMPSISVFGTDQDPFKRYYNYFIEKVVEPIKQTGNEILNLAKNAFIKNDKIIPLITFDDVQFRTPKCMHGSILRYPPVMNLFDQGRIWGWGYDIPDVPVLREDFEQKIINSVECEMKFNETKTEMVCEFYWENGWPDYTNKQINDIEITRKTIDAILKTTNLDPTCMSEERG